MFKEEFSESVGSELLLKEYKNMSKKWFQSRTIWLAVAQGIAGILLVVYAENPAFGLTGIGAGIKSLLDIYLRYVTVKPVV